MKPFNEELAITYITSETVTPIGSDDGAYLVHSIQRSLVALTWNPVYNQDATCKCGHAYYRHFDTMEDMRACGCKYCSCQIFA